MAYFRNICILAIALAMSGAADAADWQLHEPEGGHGVALTLDVGSLSYRFECAASDIIVTESGVTKLVDVKTHKTVGDDAAAQMSLGAAMMALYGGKGDPQFSPAVAVKNPNGGWDLTIRLPKDDKQLQAVGKADMISLFTTGETAAVEMDSAARSQWNSFMRRCKAES